MENLFILNQKKLTTFPSGYCSSNEEFIKALKKNLKNFLKLKLM